MNLYIFLWTGVTASDWDPQMSLSSPGYQDNLANAVAGVFKFFGRPQMSREKEVSFVQHEFLTLFSVAA